MARHVNAQETQDFGIPTERPSGNGHGPHRSEAMIHPAMTDLMARRHTGEVTTSWRHPTAQDEIRIPG